MVFVWLNSGLLKPSSVLGKGTGSGRHVSWDTSDSKPGQHTTETVLPPVGLPVPDFSLPPPDTSTKGTTCACIHKTFFVSRQSIVDLEHGCI